jgi:hypothetical protein
MLAWSAARATQDDRIGSERAVAHHLRDGAEQATDAAALIEHGRLLFAAHWTLEEGGGRPLTTGLGVPLTDPSRPLAGPRAFNRVSGPDAGSCAGCHNRPDGVVGGAGDFVAGVFQLAQRFDFVTFDEDDRTSVLDGIGNPRSTPSLFGAGYVDMLARQISADLQRTRDTIAPRQEKRLVSKGISFGTLARRADGTWDVRRVEGLPPQSLEVKGAGGKPSLLIQPWQQSGSVSSLRELTATAFNHHLGIQAAERFGAGDPDGDGVVNELTRADVTAVTLFQATLPVPGRVIPNDAAIERAVLAGERLFEQIRCTTCHIASLPLDRKGWIYTDGGVSVDLTSVALPQPRLAPASTDASTVRVPVFTDFKLHDITDPADAAASEPLDINQPVDSRAFAQGNRRFLTRRLWGVASHPAHYHHGRYTTLRESVQAHAGEALEQRRAFARLQPSEQDEVIEFLKSLRLLPPGTPSLVVDENLKPKKWPRF